MLIQDTAKTVVARADLDSRQFLLRLADIIVSLRGVEGRKSVVLFSEGFESDNVTREMESRCGGGGAVVQRGLRPRPELPVGGD